jgi:hypothetical protein
VQFYEKAHKKNEDVPKHYRIQLLKGHKRVEEETSSRKENYKILVEQGGKKAQGSSVNTTGKIHMSKCVTPKISRCHSEHSSPALCA